MAELKKRYPAHWMHQWAADLKAALAHSCERIELAGSLRRGLEMVGDIELLCIPKTIDRRDMFGEPVGSELLLDRHIATLIHDGALAYRLDSRGRRVCGPLNKLLLYRYSYHRQPAPVDIFTSDADNFGMAWLVRTGPKEFNIRVMAHFRELGMRGHAYRGITDQDGQEIPCPDEETVFRLLGWQYLPPEERR